MDGLWTEVCGQQKQSNDPGNNQHNPRYANYWAPLTRKRRPPQPTQPRHTNDWAPRTRKRHQQEHRPQRPTERSDPTQHAKGRTGDCPGPRKGATTRRNVTQGGAHCGSGADGARLCPTGPGGGGGGGGPSARQVRCSPLRWWCPAGPVGARPCVVGVRLGGCPSCLVRRSHDDTIGFRFCGACRSWTRYCANVVKAVSAIVRCAVTPRNRTKV